MARPSTFSNLNGHRSKSTLIDDRVKASTHQTCRQSSRHPGKSREKEQLYPYLRGKGYATGHKYGNTMGRELCTSRDAQRDLFEKQCVGGGSLLSLLQCLPKRAHACGTTNWFNQLVVLHACARFKKALQKKCNLMRPCFGL